jgi:hypothetical protein
MWEDGICENSGYPMTLDSIDLDSPGMKIVNFHPMNVYINGTDSSARLAFLGDNPNLTACPQETASRYRQSGDGAETVLVQLLRRCVAGGIRLSRLAETVDAFRTSVIEGGSR